MKFWLSLAWQSAWSRRQALAVVTVSVAVSVLIVTCPCALSLAAPAALVAAARGLARRGARAARLWLVGRAAERKVRGRRRQGRD